MQSAEAFHQNGHQNEYAGGPFEAEEQVQHGPFVFSVVRLASAFEVELLRGVDAVILDVDILPVPFDIIRLIRGHSDRAIYLKPIFLHGGQGPVAPVTEALCDGRIHSLERLEEAASLVEDIVQQEEEFQKAHSVSFEDNALTKLLRFLISRGRAELEPIPARDAKLGLAYPILDVNYHLRNQDKSLDVLALAEEEHLLVGEFVDAWYVCSTCSESAIHLREVCPDCGTSDLNEEDLIHHFRCAYVGPLSDFIDAMSPDDLVCPKCERKLRHVGVDYDKPAAIYTCTNGHTSQQPPVAAMCFTCGTETPAERLTKQVFKRYALTPRGREKARTGVLASVRKLSEIDGTVDHEVFRTMLRYEVERTKVTGVPSTLAVLHFANASQLFSFIGHDVRGHILQDLAHLTRQVLRASDVLAFESFSTLVGLVVALPPEETVEQLRQAARLAAQHVADRFEGYEAHLHPAVAHLQVDRPPEEQIQALIASVDAYA